MADEQQQAQEKEMQVQTSMPLSETTWIEGVKEFNFQQTPDGTRMLSFTLHNGHRYVLPLKENSPLMRAVQKAVSPVAGYLATAMGPRATPS